MCYRKVRVSIFLGFILSLGVILQPILADDGYKSFNVKLNLGLGFSRDCDLNTFVNAFDDYAKEIADEWILTKPGNIHGANYAYFLEGEFITKISRTIEVLLKGGLDIIWVELTMNY